MMNEAAPTAIAATGVFISCKKAAQQLEIIAGYLADPEALLTRIALVQFLQKHRQLRWRRMTMTNLRMMNKGLQ